MDETDMGAGASPQQDGAGSLDAATAPQVPTQRNLEAREHFDTPSWMGPDREWRPEYAAASIPPQPEPVHDVLPTPARPDNTVIISEGHWVESAPPRVLAGALLLLGVAGMIGAIVAAALTQSFVAISAAIACAFVVVVFRGALMSSGMTTVDLRGGRLTVSRDGHKDVFDLGDPAHLVEIQGTPGDARWRLRLENFDGRIVELNPQQVDAEELHPAVLHYRAIAARERLDRERRFNR